jgi:hypothetical protein
VRTVGSARVHRWLAAALAAGALLVAAAAVSGASSPVVQRVKRGGVTVEVRQNGVVTLHLVPGTAALRRLRGQNGVAECTRVLGNGQPNWFAVSYGASARFVPTVTFTAGGFVPGDHPPFDECGIEDDLGHVWPDVNRWPVEVTLTPRGTRWLAEERVSRDLSALGHSVSFRRLLAQAPGGAPSYAIVRLRFGSRLQRMSSSTSRPLGHRVGYWTDGRARVVLAELTPAARRLFMSFRHGRPLADDLGLVDGGDGPPPDLTLSTAPYQAPPGTAGAAMAVFQAAPLPSDRAPRWAWQEARQVEGRFGPVDYGHARRVLDVPRPGHPPVIGYAIPLVNGMVDWIIDRTGGGGGPAFTADNVMWATGPNGASGIMSDDVTAISGVADDGTHIPASLGRNAFYIPPHGPGMMQTLLVTLRSGETRTVTIP